MHALVLDLEGVDFVDSQGAAKLTELHELTKADGVEPLARVKHEFTVLHADGTVAALGTESMHGSVHEAVEAQLAQTPSRELPISRRRTGDRLEAS